MRLLKISMVFFTAVLFCCPASSYAQAEVQQDAGASKAAVSKIFSCYSNYSKGEFENIVSNEFMPMRGKFMDKVDAAAAQQQAVEFDFFIDQNIIANQEMVVKCKWDKKFTIIGTPGQQKAQGVSEMFFQLEDRQWKLKSIGGDNPF